MTYLLSILIPTLLERQVKCSKLLMDIYDQIKRDNLEDLIEVISMNDNRTVKLSEKRNTMQKLAQGKYFMHHDDDDTLALDFCKTVIDFIKNMKEEVDVINIEQKAFIQSSPKLGSPLNIFVVKSDLRETFELREIGSQVSDKNNEKVYKRFSWQWSLWNRNRFQHVMRSDIDKNACEDQNWLKRIQLEYPETQAWINNHILHEYHYEEGVAGSTCQ